MPPVDIGCAAFDSQFLSCFSAVSDKVPRVPVSLKTHKVWHQNSPLVYLPGLCGVCQEMIAE